MTIFVDTSAIYAAIDVGDPNHEESVSAWKRFLREPERLMSHSLVEIESVALIQARLGLEAVNAFLDLVIPACDVVEISRDDRRKAVHDLIADNRRGVSLVDRVSFNVMRELRIERAFAFDRHFVDAGFELVGRE